jgi:hypothetical protein
MTNPAPAVLGLSDIPGQGVRQMSDPARERNSECGYQPAKHQHRKHCHDKDRGTTTPDPVLQASDERVQEHREKARNQ